MDSRVLFQEEKKTRAGEMEMGIEIGSRQEGGAICAGGTTIHYSETEAEICHPTPFLGTHID